MFGWLIEGGRKEKKEENCVWKRGKGNGKEGKQMLTQCSFTPFKIAGIWEGKETSSLPSYFHPYSHFCPFFYFLPFITKNNVMAEGVLLAVKIEGGV